MTYPKTIYFNGIHFARDEKTGYYLNSTIRKRIHRYVWEYYNGEIPQGYEIHHVDFDKSNNNIGNLKLMSVTKHASLHAQIQGNKNIKNGHLNSIRHLSAKWHASKDGIEWHKKHYEKTKEKLHEIKLFNCENCGNAYEGTDNGENRFCSNKCKSAWRRKSGIDDEIRECVICGTRFKVNKYAKTITCSRSCGSKLGHKRGKS